MHIAKAAHISEKIDESKDENNNLSLLLKDLGYRSQKREDSKDILDSDGQTYPDTGDIAKYFNLCFTTLASKLANALPFAYGFVGVMSDCFKQYYENRNVNNSILKTLSCLNVSKNTEICAAEFEKKNNI